MSEPDYDILVTKLRALATEKGGDPNDVGRLTRVAMKYAKNTNRELDPSKINDALFKAANIDPTTGQPPLPQETWGQTATTALERGANAAMQFGNAAIGNTEGTVKRMLEQDAIDAGRAGRKQSLGQTAVGEIGSILTNPLTYAGGGLSKAVAPVAQAGYQGLERFRQGAVASEDNLASKSLIAGAAGGLGAVPFAKPMVGAAANLALGGGQEVAEATIDNREVDPLSLGLGAVSQVAQSAGTLAPQVVNSIQDGRKIKQVNMDAAQATARTQADAVAADRAQAATDRRIIENTGPAYNEMVNRGVDSIRGADPLPDPLSEGVLPARDAIELNKLRDEIAQQELDAEQAAANQKLIQDRLSTERAASELRSAEAELISTSTEAANKNELGQTFDTIPDVNDAATKMANTVRAVSVNSGFGSEMRDAALARVKEWRKSAIDAIASKQSPPIAPAMDKLFYQDRPIGATTPFGETLASDRNIQSETVGMQARQAIESDAVRPLREANAEANTANLAAEVARLRAENDALRKPRVTAEQQAIEADKSLAMGEVAVAPDRQLIANADKAIARVEYDMTGKTSRTPVSKPIEQPVRQTTSVDQPVSGVNPPAESAPVTTPKVVEAPVDTKSVVTTETPVQRTQTPKVEDPKIAARREKLKAEQDAKKAREEKLAADRTAVAPEPVPREAPVEEVAPAKAEDWKVYEDPVTGNRKATQGEVPTDAKVIARTEKNAVRYDAIVERSKESAKRDPWANRTRSGGTSIPSMVADATMDLAKNVVPSLKKIASGAGDIAKIPARLLAMDSKFNLDKVSAERIRQLEENTFRISDKHRTAIEKANKDTSFDFTDIKLANKLRDATNVPDGTMGNSYRSEFLDMVEGRKPVTPEFKPIVDAIWETNKFTRQMAIDNGVEVGKGFKNNVGMVRFWNSDIVNRIANDGVKDPVVKALFEDIAKSNNVQLQDVIDHFDKTVVIRDAAKAESVARLDPQELARKFANVPSHIKDPNGGWLPVLNLDPNSYVNRVTQISTKRAAAKGSFPEGLDAFADNAKLSPGEKKELASAVGDFYGIYERGIPDFALNHSKLVDYVTNTTRIINNARLSASHAANITELTSMGMVAPPQYLMKGNAKYEVGVGGMTEGRGANTLDLSKDAPLRGTALKVDRILRATGAQKIPTLVAQRMYSGIQKFYSDVNGKTSAWTEHYMEMADLSQDLRQKFRDGTATPQDIDIATTKAMRVATGRDLLGTQKAGMEHNWFARVLGPPYRGYSQKTIRNMWKATSQAYNVIRDKKLPLTTRAGIAASSLATAMTSQGINAASYNALRAVLAGSFAAALYEMEDRSENLNLQNFAWLTSNIIGGGPIGTLLEQSSKEGDISLSTAIGMASSPASAGIAVYKAITGGSIAEGAMGMVPIVNKAQKLASGEGKIEFAKNQFYRVMNEIEGKAAPDSAEMTPLNAAAKSLRNAVESGDGEQAALRELISAARLEARTRRVDVNDIVIRKLDGMRTLQKYESKLMNSESPEDRKKLREIRSRIPEDMRRDLLQFDRKIERLKARFED